MSIKVDMIGLVVKDLDASLRFYRALGMEIPDPDGGPYHEVTLDGGIRMSWNTEEMIKGIDPEWQLPVGQRVGLAYLCDSPDEVNAKFGAMVESGYKGRKAPWDAFWGQRYAQIEDPDGMIVDLFCPI